MNDSFDQRFYALVGDDAFEAIEHDALLERLAAGGGDVSDWADWRQRAAEDPQQWQSLAELQRDHASLTAMADRIGSVADSVELPGSSEHRGVIGRISAWSGWSVAAAVVLIAALIQFTDIGAPQSGQTDRDTALAGLSAGDAFKHYLDAGKQEGLVVDEVPTLVLMNVRQSPDGIGFEVAYMRQILERRRVHELHEIESVPQRTAPSGVQQVNYRRGPM